MTLQWNFVGLLGARGTKLIVGLAILFVYARIFGASATYDSWIWALGIVNAVGMMVFGPIVETIRASYSGIEYREGRTAANQYIATVAVIMIGTSIIIAAGTALILPVFAEEFVPRDSGHVSAASFFLYALAPSMVLSQAIAVITAHLNCHGKVYTPEFAGITGGGIGLALIIAFPDLPATWLLLGSYYLTLAVPLAVAASFWPMFFEVLLKLERRAFRNHAHEALSQSAPLLMPYALGQILTIFELQYTLQSGTGALSILSYALFARNTVQAIFAAALSALAVPALARVWNAEDAMPFRHAFEKWVQQCLILVTVGMIILFGFSDFVPLLLFGGNVTLEQQALLGELLRFYAAAIVAVVLFLVAGSGLLASRRAKTYASCSALACVISIALLLTLFPRFGVVAIPIGLAISHSVAAMLMLRAINPSDAWRVTVGAGTRMIIILVTGSAVHWLDSAIAEQFGLAQRLAVGALIATMLVGIWWIAEHRLGRGMARSVLTI